MQLGNLIRHLYSLISSKTFDLSVMKDNCMYRYYMYTRKCQVLVILRFILKTQRPLNCYRTLWITGV